MCQVLSHAALDILAAILHRVDAPDVCRLWTTGDHNLQMRMAAPGVVKTLHIQTKTFPPLLQCFPHLQGVILDSSNRQHGIWHNMAYMVGLDMRKLPKMLVKLHLITPDSLSMIDGQPIRDLFPALQDLEFSHQYVPETFDKTQFIDGLPPLTNLQLPYTILFQHQHLLLLPPTITSLAVDVALESGEEHVMRSAFERLPLRELRIQCERHINWTKLPPAGLELFAFSEHHGIRAPNNPLNYRSSFSPNRRDRFFATPEDLLTGLPAALQSLTLQDEVVRQFTVAHIAALPRSLLDLQLLVWTWREDGSILHSDPAVLKALPPNIRFLRMEKFVISSPSVWTEVPKSLTEWDGLTFHPSTDVVFDIPPTLDTPNFAILSDAQAAALPTTTRRFNLEEGASVKLSAVGALALAQLPLMQLTIETKPEMEQTSGVATLLQNLPTSLVELNIKGELPSGVPLSDLPFQTLKYLTKLDIPSTFFPSVSHLLPLSLSQLAVRGVFPQTGVKEERLWCKKIWPAQLDSLLLDVVGTYNSSDDLLWNCLPPRLESLTVMATDFERLPPYWATKLPRSLRRLCLEIHMPSSSSRRLGLRHYVQKVSSAVKVTDQLIKGLPPGLRELQLIKFEHDLTLDGIRALPQTLQQLQLGDFIRDDGSPGLREFFGKKIKDESTLLSQDEVKMLDVVLAGVPPNLYFQMMGSRPGLDWLLQRRRFEALRRHCPNVNFVVPNAETDPSQLPYHLRPWPAPPAAPDEN